MYWHPDRNEFFPAAKDFRNGDDYTLRGWDTAEAGLGVPQPWAQLNDLITFKEAGGEYPHPSKLNAIPSRLMDVGINNYNLQIATMRMTQLSERYETEQRPTPSSASVPRDVGDVEFFDRTHTIYAPMEREDMFVSWNYRRSKEGRKDYKGGIIWHEGEYRFKKDVTLQGSVPIPLIIERCPSDLAGNIGTMFIVTDADGTTKKTVIRDEKMPERMTGRIQPGGYAAYMTTPVGYHGLLVPADMDFAYDARFPATDGFKAGLGQNGQVIKAGTVLKYRFGVGTFADDKFDNALLEHTTKAMNLGGGQAGYPVEMKVGEIKDAVFFFTAAAKKGEALFSLGPQSLIIDLPVRVQGIENNGCVAVYSTKCPWFRFIPVDADGTAWLTEPIDQKNEMWVGNVFTCDNKEVKLTLIVDGQSEGQQPFLELHNPTDKDIETTVRSPEHAPIFGGMTGTVKIPAGESVRLWIDGKSLRDKQEVKKSGASAEEKVVAPQLKILCGDKCSKTGEMRKPESDSVTKGAVVFTEGGRTSENILNPPAVSKSKDYDYNVHDAVYVCNNPKAWSSYSPNLYFIIVVPKEDTGKLRLFFCDDANNALTQDIFVAGKKISSIAEFKSPGKWVEVTYSAEDSKDGKLVVLIKSTCSRDPMISTVEVYSDKVPATK